MSEFRAIAILVFRPVIGSQIEIDVALLKRVSLTYASAHQKVFVLKLCTRIDDP